jgi:hypothetical protein
MGVIMVRPVNILDRLLAEVPAAAQRVYSQPRDMSPEAIQRRIEERAAKAEASSQGKIKFKNEQVPI